MERDPRIGAVLQDRYRIVDRVAEGAMGVVYRGERIGLERTVAIKFLHESVTADAESRRRFEVEAKAASRLNHPNCVAVIDFGVDKDSPFLVMDFVTGKTLRDIVRHGPPALDRALELATQLLAGLAHAHDHDVIHRDIKPDNVIVYSDSRSEHARIIDFGLAKLTGASTITDGVAVGTPSYMSPEQTLGQRADARSDVYGAGVLVFELLTGTKPYRADTPFDVMRMHREAPIPRLAEVAPDRAIPAALEAVVHKALAKQPEDRYPTAVEFAAALKGASLAAARSGDVDRAKRGASRGARSIDGSEQPVVSPHHARIVVILLGVLAAGIAVWFVYGRDPEADPERPAPTRVEVAPDAAPDAAVARAPVETPGVAEALALAKTQPAQAITALEKLRAQHPASGHVSFALGAINADRAWWTASVDAYAEAIQKEPAYRSDPRVVGDLVRALRSDKAHERAATLIVGALGDSARAELDTAATSGDTPELRARAARVRERMKP